MHITHHILINSLNYLKIANETQADFKHTQLKKLDLVKLNDGETAGVILSLDRDSANIINEKGQLQQISTLIIRPCPPNN